jgi:FkbM family methyltransferase
MWLDSVLFKNRWLRDGLTSLIPDRERLVHICGRNITISSRFEVGLARLAGLMKLSPTADELGSLISIIGLVPRGGSFIDVGANVGFYSIPMASIGDIAGFSVIALEPNKSTAARLRRNLEPYRCATVMEVAAAGNAGTLEMGYLANSSATFSVSGKTSLGAVRNSAQVTAIRLDDMLWPKPWVIKIDVEGYEMQVLDGLQQRIADGTVTAVMVDGFADKAIPNQLLEQGFSLYDGRSLHAFRPGDTFNLLALRQQWLRPA